MAKDASLFSFLSEATKKKIFLADYYALIVIGCGDIKCQNGVITNVYRVPSLSSNSLYISQLAQTSKKVEFWPDQFVLKDVNNS
jgi:hypothetical protein